MARKSAQIIGRGVYLRSYGRAAPFPIPVRSLYYLCFDYIELNALAIIYSCTIGQVHLLVYYIKLKSRLSVHLRHGIISVVSAWIDLGLGLCIAESFET